MPNKLAPQSKKCLLFYASKYKGHQYLDPVTFHEIKFLYPSLLPSKRRDASLLDLTIAVPIANINSVPLGL